MGMGKGEGAKSTGYRAGTRDLFTKKFRSNGYNAPITTFMRNYKVGDVVDVVCDSRQQKGMPHKYYHGRSSARLTTAAGWSERPAVSVPKYRSCLCAGLAPVLVALESVCALPLAGHAKGAVRGCLAPLLSLAPEGSRVPWQLCPESGAVHLKLV